MSTGKLISADSHVVEPPDLWATRIDPKFREDAPRLVTEDGIHRWYVAQGVSIGSVGAASDAGKRYDEPEALSIEAKFEEVPTGAYDPHARLKDQEIDGVVGEIVYPTIATRLYTLDIDSQLLSACFRALNDWMVDFSKPYPNTFKGSGLINLDDVQEGVKELERCAKAGLVAAAIPAYISEDREYYMPEFAPLWEAAQELGIPLGMHDGSTRPGPGQVVAFAKDVTVEGVSAFRTTQDYWVRRSLAGMIFGGVFQRYPGLRVGAVEYELGWAPYFINQMDMAYKEHRYVTEIQFKEDKAPSDFFHDNIYVTFMEDPIGVVFRSIIGVDNIMWSSDYPHRESTWPHSRETLARVLDGVPEEDKRKLTFSNAARMFNFS